MKNKIIESIVEAENKAQQLQLEGEEKANQIISKAEEESIRLKNEAVDFAKVTLNKKTAEVEAEVKKNYLKSLEAYELKAEEIEKKAQSKYDKALKILVESI